MTEIKNGMPNVHPGEMLKEMFIDSVYETKEAGIKAISEKTEIPVGELLGFVTGFIDVTEDFAKKLAKGLETSPELWLNLQKTFDEKYLASTEEVIVRVPKDIAEAFNAAKQASSSRVVDQFVANLISTETPLIY